MTNQIETYNNTKEYFSDSTNIFNSMFSYVNSITIILAIIFVFGIILNTFSIFVILKSSKLEPINLLILNLALADLVYIAGIPLFVAHLFSQSWPFRVIGCQLFFLTDFIGMTVGVYTVAALSVERYIEVTDKKKKLDKYSNKFKILIIGVCLILVWILGLLFSLSIVFSIELYKSIDDAYSCESQWNDKTLNLFFFIKFILIFFVPFSIIVFSSVKLLFFLKKWKRETMSRLHFRVRNSNVPSDTSVLGIKNEAKHFVYKVKKNAVREKAINIVLSIVLLFVIQWTPLWLFELYKSMSASDLLEYIQIANVFTTVISYSNSISNPLLYIFLTHKFPLIQKSRTFLFDLFFRFKFSKKRPIAV